MIKKIISIKNVGRFLKYSAVGDVELKRYNLIFAENGRGKTTLCAILRSLKTGDVSHVLGRTTLGRDDTPEIKILLDDETSTFNAMEWSTTVPNLAIFDSRYISENIYSGDSIDLDHRRNLYRVIVGKKGVDLAHKIEGLDAKIRIMNTEIRDKLRVVQMLVPQGLTVKDFLSLLKDTAIDASITEKEKELEAVKQGDQIKSRVVLSELSLPAFPDKFAPLLGKTIEGVAEDAERCVTKQIETHSMHKRGEPWLSEGLAYICSNTCPFCAQSLDKVSLIAAYKAYFSEAYNTLRTEINSMRTLINEALSDREIGWVERTLDQNTSSIEFWSRYCAITPPPLDGADSVGDTLRTLRQAASSLLDRKAANPLDSVEADAIFPVAHSAFVALQSEIATYNQAVLKINTAITAKKAATAATDVRSVEKTLTLLQATKKRHETDGSEASKKYEAALAKKIALEEQKEKFKEELNEYTTDVISEYEGSINRLLDDFHAGFRITETRHGYPGGVASSSFNILINDTSVELGDSNTPLNRPSFKNTLSSGDKSTLALACFLSQLEHDPERDCKIVVFDDPFNSQDSFRKDCTIRKIKESGDCCHQVIVLSHDKSFLKRIWDRLAHQRGDRKCLQFTRIGLRDTKISTWDIEYATQSPHAVNRNKLENYYNNNEGDPRDVVTKIRPILETYCSNLYPEFVDDTLGTIIGKVQDVGTTHQLYDQLGELDALNEYTCRYHHGENEQAATESIDENELQGFARRTLSIIGGNC